MSAKWRNLFGYVPSLLYFSSMFCICYNFWCEIFVNSVLSFVEIMFRVATAQEKRNLDLRFSRQGIYQNQLKISFTQGFIYRQQKEHFF